MNYISYYPSLPCYSSASAQVFAYSPQPNSLSYPNFRSPLVQCFWVTCEPDSAPLPCPAFPPRRHQKQIIRSRGYCAALGPANDDTLLVLSAVPAVLVINLVGGGPIIATSLGHQRQLFFSSRLSTAMLRYRAPMPGAGMGATLLQSCRREKPCAEFSFPTVIFLPLEFFLSKYFSSSTALRIGGESEGPGGESVPGKAQVRRSASAAERYLGKQKSERPCLQSLISLAYFGGRMKNIRGGITHRERLCPAL